MVHSLHCVSVPRRSLDELLRGERTNHRTTSGGHLPNSLNYALPLLLIQQRTRSSMISLQRCVRRLRRAFDHRRAPDRLTDRARSRKVRAKRRRQENVRATKSTRERATGCCPLVVCSEEDKREGGRRGRSERASEHLSFLPCSSLVNRQQTDKSESLLGPQAASTGCCVPSPSACQCFCVRRAP